MTGAIRCLLLDETNELHNRSMHISGMFEKAEVEGEKANIENVEADIERVLMTKTSEV